jgi:hypothetical protein
MTTTWRIVTASNLDPSLVELQDRYHRYFPKSPMAAAPLPSYQAQRPGRAAGQGTTDGRAKPVAHAEACSDPCGDERPGQRARPNTLPATPDHARQPPHPVFDVSTLPADPARPSGSQVQWVCGFAAAVSIGDVGRHMPSTNC